MRLLLALLVMGLLLILISLAVGSTSIDWLSLSLSQQLVVWDIRLPRSLMAWLTGAGLGIAGAALQGLLRNPLAGPGILGIGSSAALGAVLAFYFGLSQWFSFAVPVMALLFSLLVCLLLLFLVRQQASTLTLILCGVSISTLCSALLTLAINFAPNPYALREVVHWLLGSVSLAAMPDIALMLPFMVVGMIMIYRQGPYLDALTLGEETALSLGFGGPWQLALLVLGIALCVGTATAFAGSIGFLGLMVPHLCRTWVGASPSKLLPVCALTGGNLLLVADILIRSFSQTQELKLGVITSLIGAPFLLIVVYRMRRTLI